MSITQFSICICDKFTNENKMKHTYTRISDVDDNPVFSMKQRMVYSILDDKLREMLLHPNGTLAILRDLTAFASIDSNGSPIPGAREYRRMAKTTNVTQFIKEA
jgi:hypothetical protein